IISKSLGYEVGGAIGLPLYIAQAISVAFYITGFGECWVSVFPGHDFILVCILTWLALLIISYTSAKFAFRLQYVIMAIISLSIISAFMAKGAFTETLSSAGVAEVPFWQVFAIFFPAVTGILAGISMSGELKNPERNIPLGTISAIIVSFAIYLAVTFWFSGIASPRELVNNTSIIIDVSRWRFLIIAGIMGATLSSALSMFVASPRTLLALAKHRVVPFSRSFSHINEGGEPHAAILFTAALALLTIALGNLNSIAGILTMFFLITYGMLNIAVFIEKGIGIVSFRPAFKVPLFVPFLGGAACIYAMFLINPLFSIIALVTTAAIYIALLRKGSPKQWPDVRRGAFIFIAEQAIKIASGLPYHPKIWKPNLLIPVEAPKDWLGITDIIKAITYPRGRIEMFTVVDSKNFDPALEKNKKEELFMLEKAFSEEGILASSSVIKHSSFLEAADIILQGRKDFYLPPNVVFFKLGFSPGKDATLNQIVQNIDQRNFGVMVFNLHPKLGLGRKALINLWIREGSPNLSLAVLIALQIKRNWEAELRILQAVSDENGRIAAQNYLVKLKRVLRLPKDTETSVLTGDFNNLLSRAPLADINIFGMPQECDFSQLRDLAVKINSSVLFLRDSKQESAVA
ncbi:MAG: amino acid permease, partial [Candidatus Omnitrophica bacterium]|nr:amino acid permease [Candidatus Omnitrophota bacterium]